MHSVGDRVSIRGAGGNYRFDRYRPPLERAVEFAVGGSVFNEVIHTVCGLYFAAAVVFLGVSGTIGLAFATQAVLAAINLGCVSIQRYNRARSMKLADHLIRSGAEFSPGYKNWLGIDGRAVQRLAPAGGVGSGQTLH